MVKLLAENASAAIIIDKKNNFLLQKRDNKKGIFFPGHWGLFGGAKNLNESYENTLKRELDEEIGFKPKNFNFYIKLSFELKKKKIHRYFYISKFDNLSKMKISLNEGEKYKIFSKKELKNFLNKKNLFVPYDQLALWFYINKVKII